MTAPTLVQRMSNVNEHRSLDAAAAATTLAPDIEGHRQFSGYAAKFNTRTDIGDPHNGGWVEEIDPGAFTATLRNSDVRMLVDHDSQLVVARQSAGDLALSVDATGLHVRADLDVNVSYVGDLARNIEGRKITGMSFGFMVVRDRWTREAGIDVRRILEVRLLEVSAVTFPAYEQTEASVRTSVADVRRDRLGTTPLDTTLHTRATRARERALELKRSITGMTEYQRIRTEQLKDQNAANVALRAAAEAPEATEADRSAYADGVSRAEALAEELDKSNSFSRIQKEYNMDTSEARFGDDDTAPTETVGAWGETRTTRPSRWATVGQEHLTDLDTLTESAPLARSQKFADTVAKRAGHTLDPLDWGKTVRGIVTGNWAGADLERRTMSGAATSAGGYAIPLALSGQIVDAARANSVALTAGATLVPMTSRYVDVAVLEADPTPAWRLENGLMATTEGQLGRVRLSARSLGAKITLSQELIEDAPNLAQVVSDAMAAQFALAIDRAALMGAGTPVNVNAVPGTDDAEPTGLVNWPGITTTEQGAQFDYDTLIDAVYRIAQHNHHATVAITSPANHAALAKLKTTDGQYLAPPPVLGELLFGTTNQVPSDTEGRATVFVGDWKNLYVGVRTELALGVDFTGHADNGQVALYMRWRGDVAIVKPRAFNVLTVPAA